MIDADKVLEILTKYGVDAVLKDYPSASFDAATNQSVDGTVNPVPVKAVPPYKNLEGFKTTQLISSGKGMTIFANKNLGVTVIKAGLIISISGNDWTITGVTPISTSEGAVAYQVEIEI